MGKGAKGAKASSIGVDKLASPTKKGQDRESLSNARDVERLTHRNNAMLDENDDLRREVKLLVDSESDLRLQFHKLLKQFESESSSLRKSKHLAQQKTHELKQLKRETDSERSTLVAQLNQSMQRCVDLTAEGGDLRKRLGVESAALRHKTDDHDQLEQEHFEQTKMHKSAKNELLVKDAKINTLEHNMQLTLDQQLKLEMRHRNLREQLKSCQERLVGKTVQAGQAFSEMAKFRTELALLKQTAGGDAITPAIVIEIEQLKLERNGFLTQIRDAGDDLLKLQAAHAALHESHESETTERARLAAALHEKGEETARLRQRTASLQTDVSRAATELASKRADWNTEQKTLQKTLDFAILDACKQRAAAESAEHAWGQIHQRAVQFRDAATAAEAREVQLDSKLATTEATLGAAQQQVKRLQANLTSQMSKAVSESQSLGTAMAEVRKELVSANSEIDRLCRMLAKAEGAEQLAEKERDRAIDAQKELKTKLVLQRERADKLVYERQQDQVLLRSAKLREKVVRGEQDKAKADRMALERCDEFHAMDLVIVTGALSTVCLLTGSGQLRRVAGSWTGVTGSCTSRIGTWCG